MRHDVDRLREALRSYSLQRIANATGITTATLRRYRDGKTCPTYEAFDRVFDVVLADALKIVSAGRPRKAQTVARNTVIASSAS
jgi:hypothetical protein